jgi:uncharacterized protein
MTTFSVRRLRLRPGEEHREAVELELSPFELGGERYLPVPAVVSAALAIARAVTGTVFTLSFETRLHGPCFRCLADAVLDVPIHAREYQASDPEDEELTTPYLVDGDLDLSAWARDAIALALPEKILCRPDCAGLCPECGKNLNEEPHEHAEEATDPRWAALESLRSGIEREGS